MITRGLFSYPSQWENSDQSRSATTSPGRSREVSDVEDTEAEINDQVSEVADDPEAVPGQFSDADESAIGTGTEREVYTEAPVSGPS